MNIKEIEPYIIYKVLAGSHAYGLNTPESDEDWRGVFIPPKEYLLSPFKKIDQVTDNTNDTVIYNLYKFVILATQNNPNILELLFIDDKYIDIIKPEFQEIRKHRDLFLSAKCRFTYCKYAFSQLKRIKGHKRWLDNPPKQVKRSDYNLLEHEKLFDNKSLQSLMDNFINEIKGGLINGVAEFYQVDKNDDLNNMISDILSGVSQQYFKNFALQYFTNKDPIGLKMD